MNLTLCLGERSRQRGPAPWGRRAGTEGERPAGGREGQRPEPTCHRLRQRKLSHLPAKDHITPSLNRSSKMAEIIAGFFSLLYRRNLEWWLERSGHAIYIYQMRVSEPASLPLVNSILFISRIPIKRALKNVNFTMPPSFLVSLSLLPDPEPSSPWDREGSVKIMAPKKSFKTGQIAQEEDFSL